MRAWLIVFGVLCPACAMQRTTPTAHELFPGPAPIEVVVVPNPTPPPAPVPEPVLPGPPADATAIESNGGTYVVRVTPAPSSLPENQTFQLDVWVIESAAPRVTPSNIELAVSAAMPEHGHGMNRDPLVERAPDQHFVVRGMLLHMTGRWELYFDITRDAITERAQVDVVLE